MGIERKYQYPCSVLRRISILKRSKSVICQKMLMYEQLKSQFLVNSNFWHNIQPQGAHGLGSLWAPL